MQITYSWIVQKNVIYVDIYFYVSVWIHVDVYGREIANSKANESKRLILVNLCKGYVGVHGTVVILTALRLKLFTK